MIAYGLEKLTFLDDRLASVNKVIEIVKTIKIKTTNIPHLAIKNKITGKKGSS